MEVRETKPPTQARKIHSKEIIINTAMRLSTKHLSANHL